MIRCLSCGDIIESTHGHDYKVCRCGNVAVDGGRDYLKRSYPADRSQVDSYEELSQWE
jgi:DNA-directed RNA polymerase subunit N (RpoN/RPB10)